MSEDNVFGMDYYNTEYSLVSTESPVSIMSLDTREVVNIYRVNERSQLPTYGTSRAACFDLRANFIGRSVKFFYANGSKGKVDCPGNVLGIPPRARVLVPSGLIFDLTPSQNLRLHPRSSVAIKRGLTLANCEAVVDEDYVEETFIALLNTTDQTQLIEQDERICQGEIVHMIQQNRFQEIGQAPAPKGDRTGGCGSTGRM